MSRNADKTISINNMYCYLSVVDVFTFKQYFCISKLCRSNIEICNWDSPNLESTDDWIIAEVKLKWQTYLIKGVHSCLIFHEVMCKTNAHLRELSSKTNTSLRGRWCEGGYFDQYVLKRILREVHVKIM